MRIYIYIYILHLNNSTSQKLQFALILLISIIVDSQCWEGDSVVQMMSHSQMLLVIIKPVKKFSLFFGGSVYYQSHGYQNILL